MDREKLNNKKKLLINIPTNKGEEKIVYNSDKKELIINFSKADEEKIKEIDNNHQKYLFKIEED